MDERGFDGINVIPFIDIMLVLLTIVLTTATFIASGSIPVDLPRAKNGVSEEKGLTLTIDKNGTLFYREKSYSMTELRRLLSREDRKALLLIRADKSLQLQPFVDVVELVKEMGFSRLSLQTEMGL